MNRLLAILFLAINVSASTYYIDATGGSDSNNGTSSGTAWQTLAHATNQTFISGDSILLKRGEVWNETFTIHWNGVILDAYGSGELPIIDCQQTRRYAVLNTTATNTITRNLHLKNGGGSTGALWDSEANGTNTIDGCFLQIHTNDSLVASGVSGCIIVSNCVLTGAGDEAFTLHNTATGIVANCTFTNNRSAINNSGTAMAMTVNDCIFQNNGDGSGGFGDIDALDTGINVFNRCHFNGRLDGVAMAFFKATTSPTTFNYCIFDASHSASVSGQSIGIDGANNFNNCVFYGGSGKGSFSIATTGTLGMTNCIVQDWWRMAIISGSGIVNMDHCITNSITTGTQTVNANKVAGDPLFANAVAGNFNLTAGSPAIRAGLNIGLTTDLDGHGVANPPSIGAYEFIVGPTVSFSGNAAFSGRISQ